MNAIGLASIGVTFLRDAHAMERLLPDWTALWRRLPGTTPFQAPAWLIPWWRYFGWGTPLIIAVHIGGRLAALAPFFVAGGVLRPIGSAVSDYVDILLDPELPEAAVALAAALRESSADWDEAHFEDLPPAASLLRLAAPEGFCDRILPADPCPVLSFPGGNFRAALPGLMYRNLGAAWRAAERLGTVTIARDLSVFESLVELHAARRNGRGDGGVLEDARVCAFHRAALPLLAAEGLLRLYGVAVAGRIVAAYYGFLHRGRAYAYLQGFDPVIESQSLGTVAIGQGLAAASEEGAEEFHFLRGGERCKYQWGAVARHNQRRHWKRR